MAQAVLYPSILEHMPLHQRSSVAVQKYLSNSLYDMESNSALDLSACLLLGHAAD